MVSELVLTIGEKFDKSLLNDLKTHRVLTNLRKFSDLGSGEKNAAFETLMRYAVRELLAIQISIMSTHTSPDLDEPSRLVCETYV